MSTRLLAQEVMRNLEALLHTLSLIKENAIYGGLLSFLATSRLLVPHKTRHTRPLTSCAFTVLMTEAPLALRHAKTLSGWVIVC